MVNQWCEEMVGNFVGVLHRAGAAYVNTQDMEPEEIERAKRDLEDYIYGAFEPAGEFHIPEAVGERLTLAAEELEGKMKNGFDRAALQKFDAILTEEFIKCVKDTQCFNGW